VVLLHSPPLRGPLWITHAAEVIRDGMSGSPIVTEIGTAIGVVCTAAAPWEGGPNPRLSHNLPDGCWRHPNLIPAFTGVARRWRWAAVGECSLPNARCALARRQSTLTDR